MRYRTCKLKPLKKLGIGAEGKVSIPPLNNFSNSFSFLKNRKTLVFPQFSNPN